MSKPETVNILYHLKPAHGEGLDGILGIDLVPTDLSTFVSAELTFVLDGNSHSSEKISTQVFAKISKPEITSRLESYLYAGGNPSGFLHMAANENYREIRLYDTGDNVYDRFTCVYMDEPESRNDLFCSVGMSEHPFHPQGFGQHGSAAVGSHLGKRIRFTDLPTDCQKLVARDLMLKIDENDPTFADLIDAGVSNQGFSDEPEIDEVMHEASRQVRSQTNGIQPVNDFAH